MRSWTDKTGTSWTVDVDVSALKRVRGLVGVDLMQILGGELIEKLVGDPVMLCDVLYALCKPEADGRGIDDEAFGRRLAGDSIEHATTALLEALVDFFPNARDRALLQRVLTATTSAAEKARDLVEQRLEGGELERIVDRALQQTPGGSSGSAPASPASTPEG